MPSNPKTEIELLQSRTLKPQKPPKPQTQEAPNLSYPDPCSSPYPAVPQFWDPQILVHMAPAHTRRLDVAQRCRWPALFYGSRV